MQTVVVSRIQSANKACQAVASIGKKKSVNVMSASAEKEMGFIWAPP